MRAAFWAILVDTWHQSRHQRVYLILAAALLVAALGSVLIVKVRPNPAGLLSLTLRGRDASSPGLESPWDKQYRHALAGERIEARLRQPVRDYRQARDELRQVQREIVRVRPQASQVAEQKALEQRLSEARLRVQIAMAEREQVEREVSSEAQILVDQRAVGVSVLAKGVEFWTSKVTAILFWIVMFGFISTAAGYFPGMMKTGAIELVVAKPVNRLQIFSGRYLGGLVLGSLALLVSELVVLIGLGISTGIWHWNSLAAFPLTLLSLALLFALVVLVGIVTRSTALSMLAGYAFYLVVDTAIWAIQAIDAAGMKLGWLEGLSQFSRSAFPGFSRLREAASAAVLNIPLFDWQSVWLAAGWLVALLAASYALFRRLDF
jgi:ABC-type transport system involved in multi-copper enzyme maturation permease subunit